ncbi:AzlC family ABC transporter permease [Undibacterium parvum]|uniref:Branched-chain amino acid ABC transporter permease n=1 Tax=Undibacterium parvum TaxID=401471 RepID=A0A3S9HK78_9BURK|nr:AzlC family ABC transporter permease [Undibacterium parvum]AZP12506.1 branched-chain amino acid ABC transporter permease [Undibacterium parvum]
MNPHPLSTSAQGQNNFSVLTLTTPVAMGYIPLGMVFGFLFVQAGAAWWLAVLTSLFVYAGAAQYMMIPMLAAGLPLATIALATLIVNLRHMFYGLSLLNKLPQKKLLRWYMIFALTDETYSVLTTLPVGTSDRQMALLALLNQSWWVLGTLLGALIGAQAQITLAGLDFVLAALFAVLTVEQWRSKQSPAPLWVALAAYAVAYLLAPKHALVISIALSIVAGLFWRAPRPAAAAAATNVQEPKQ